MTTLQIAMTVLVLTILVLFSIAAKKADAVLEEKSKEQRAQMQQELAAKAKAPKGSKSTKKK